MQATIRYKAGYIRMNAELYEKHRRIIVPQILRDAAKDSSATMLKDCFTLNETEISEFKLAYFNQNINPYNFDILDDIYKAFNSAICFLPEGVGNARTQKVDIYFNYVGQINIDLSAEELAEIKAKEEQAEKERLARQRAREKAYREKRKAEKIAANGGEIVKKKVCPYCGTEFTPTSNRQIFCSDECCYQARQDKKKAEREAERGNHYYRQRKCGFVANCIGLHTVNKSSVLKNVEKHIIMRKL